MCIYTYIRDSSRILYKNKRVLKRNDAFTVGNPTNRDRSRHVDVEVHFLRDLVRDGHFKLVKYDGTQNVPDALTKSLPRPAFEKHKEYMAGTSIFLSLIY